MLNPIDFFKTELDAILEDDATTLVLPDAAANLLCDHMVAGSAIPLIVNYSGGGFEVITIDSATDKVFSISRAQYGTTAARWPSGACVQSGWTRALLDEYICQVQATCA